MLPEEERKRRTVHKRLRFNITMPKLFQPGYNNTVVLTIDEFVADIEEIKTQVLSLQEVLQEQGYQDIVLEFSDPQFVHFRATVSETDAQYNARIIAAEKRLTAAEKRKRTQEAKEKAELEKLKKKYEREI